MTFANRLLAGAVIGTMMIASTPLMAQGAAQTVALTKIDPSTLATGYRASKVVGATVVNETNETVGTIDDLIITTDGNVPYAVISVGGFLGMGTKYVVVSSASLVVQDKNMLLRGATKETMQSLPDYKYAK
ncbi:PRC-barrel domain-containing protein [Oryzibacter oryziterrae]|uniref:PRC-barrel domain-containing protein n=1 Tax=Oryzibacter oryziterrae TaxID=2766474 RepID=UPI001F3DD6C0|nr:PRC-barrel domain-containing protein [Oryzibacter oryziterrae]